jgi:hypothetical protein
MSKQRHCQRSQGGTTPETKPQNGAGVAQFSVSEVAQFWMSVDNREGALITDATLAPSSGLLRLSWAQRSWKPPARMDQPSRKSRAEIPATPAAPSLAIR